MVNQFFQQGFYDGLREHGLIKEARSPALIGTLLGGAAGGGLGYALTNDDENLTRNILIGMGIGGGLGGLGGYGISQLYKPSTKKLPAVQKELPAVKKEPPVRPFTEKERRIVKETAKKAIANMLGFPSWKYMEVPLEQAKKHVSSYWKIFSEHLKREPTKPLTKEELLAFKKALKKTPVFSSWEKGQNWLKEQILSLWKSVPEHTKEYISDVLSPPQPPPGAGLESLSIFWKAFKQALIEDYKERHAKKVE